MARGEINRRYLHDEIADRLRDLIIAGELEPLSRINEPELAERFGTSRTPLREAIKILAAEGLIELMPNRGARIANPSRSEVEHIIEVVAALEGSAAELAARNLSDEDLQLFKDLDDRMFATWKAGDEDGYLRTVKEIHASLILASGNPVLQDLHSSFANRVQRARSAVRKTPEQWAASVEDHRKITELLARREAVALAEHMRNHVRRQKDALIAAFESRSSATAEG